MTKTVLPNSLTSAASADLISSLSKIPVGEAIIDCSELEFAGARAIEILVRFKMHREKIGSPISIMASNELEDALRILGLSEHLNSGGG